jgi:hypothetical protein
MILGGGLTCISPIKRNAVFCSAERTRRIEAAYAISIGLSVEIY